MNTKTDEPSRAEARRREVVGEAGELGLEIREARDGGFEGLEAEERRFTATKIAELDEIMNSLCQIFRWDLLVGERYGRFVVLFMDSKRFLQLVEEKKKRVLAKKEAPLKWEQKLEAAAKAEAEFEAKEKKAKAAKHKRRSVSVSDSERL